MFDWNKSINLLFALLKVLYYSMILLMAAKNKRNFLEKIVITIEIACSRYSLYQLCKKFSLFIWAIGIGNLTRKNYFNFPHANWTKALNWFSTRSCIKFILLVYNSLVNKTFASHVIWYTQALIVWNFKEGEAQSIWRLSYKTI